MFKGLITIYSHGHRSMSMGRGQPLSVQASVLQVRGPSPRPPPPTAGRVSCAHVTWDERVSLSSLLDVLSKISATATSHPRDLKQWHLPGRTPPVEPAGQWTVGPLLGCPPEAARDLAFQCPPRSPPLFF